jgi:hypothetical protein
VTHSGREGLAAQRAPGSESPGRMAATRPPRHDCRPCSERAAEGIRTLDLLHGKRNVGSRGSEERPAKCRFPSYRRSAMLSSLCREIAGVSGLKPDSGPRRLGRRLRSTVGSHPAPSSPLAVGRRCSCWRSSTRAAVRPPATAAADACSSPPAVTLDGARVLRSGECGSARATAPHADASVESHGKQNPWPIRLAPAQMAAAIEFRAVRTSIETGELRTSRSRPSPQEER